MKKISAMIAVVLAVLSIAYMSNTALAGRATEPSGQTVDKTSATPSDKITFTCSPGDYNDLFIDVKLNGGSGTFHNLGAMTSAGTLVSLKKTGQEILNACTDGSGNVVGWRVRYNGGASFLYGTGQDITIQ